MIIKKEQPLIDGQISAGRNGDFDALKFNLMFVVVFGHCLWEHYNETALINTATYIIYSFHMPLFVWISGYFSKKMEKQKFKHFIIKTFETLLLFQVLCILMCVITHKDINIKLLISPYSIYWYLLNLIIWRMVLQYMPERILSHKWIVIATSAIAGLFIGFIPVDTELSLQRIFAFLPFFVLGYYSGASCLFEKIRKTKMLLIVTVFVMSTIIFYFLYCNDMLSMPILYENTHYHIIGKDLISRFLIWCVAIGYGICFIRLSMPTKIGMYFGALTLFIFVYHQFVIEVLMNAISKIGVELNIISIFLVSVIVMGICCFISNVKLFRVAVNPVTCLLEHLFTRK